MYEYEVPQLVHKSEINEEGKIELDWSDYYDLKDKYFVIYRKKDFHCSPLPCYNKSLATVVLIRNGCFHRPDDSDIPKSG